jgi:hypothetical protein
MPYDNKKKHRDYDKESGMSRTRFTRKPDTESDSESSSEEDRNVKVAKREIMHKEYKEDARRPKPTRVAKSKPDEDDKPGTTVSTEQTGSADKQAAKEAGLPVAPHFTLLSVMDKVGVIKPVHHSLNTYTVNTSVMFTLLHGFQSSLSGNTRISNYFGEYFSLGSRIYYAYLMYYQILRAQQAANVPLDAISRRVLRKLETTLPIETCPVAGPLVGWFQSLGAYKSDDHTYSWTYPIHQTFIAAHTLFDCGNDAYFYPNIPLMVALFNTLARIPNHAADYQNNSGYIVPVRNVANAAVNWLGQQWELDQATVSTLPLLSNFSRPGLSYALPEQSNYMNGSRIAAWKRINVPNITQAVVTDNFENYLLCSGNDNLNWLRTFRNWAHAEAKFAKGSVNLSQISPTCGPNVLCLTVYENPANRPVQFSEPWISYCNDYYNNKGFTTQTVSSSVDKISITHAHTYRHIIEISGTGNRLPLALANATSIVVGPLYRLEAPNGTYTGGLRNRWKLEATPEEGFDSDLCDIINMHIYSPMGEEPELTRSI